MEIEELIKNYLDENKRIKNFPAKKNKLYVLEYISKKLDKNKKYSEKDINEIIDEWTLFKDPATIRREMYNNHLNRTNDGKEYWLE